MNITQITMPQDKARRAFLDYKHAVDARHNDEDIAIMKGYKALAEGSALIDLRSAFRVAGVEKGLPKIAVCRADFTWCWFSFREATRAQFIGTHDTSRNAGMNLKAHRYNSVCLPEGVLTRPDNAWPRARALLPSVPPQFRPKHHLRNYHILWEAEWQPIPPTDPLLLKHLGGTLYVVLAQWDLTELERAVLANRMST
jgi:hypothetical protein